MVNSFKARSIFIFFVFIILYSAIAVNLYVIQIVHHEIYRKIAYQQYNVTITQHPPRGHIIDRAGNYLAMNKNYCAAFILPQQLMHKDKLIAFLSVHFPESHARYEHNKDKHFMFIKRKLSQQEQDLIASHALSDIRFLTEPGRYYPVASAAQLVGLTSIDNRGIMGIELAYHDYLAGTPTTYILEKDARSGYYYFTKETTVHGDEGKELSLTIDADLQFLVQEAVLNTMQNFNAKEGAALIMDPVSGDILAMVSCPGFDPHDTHTITADTSRNRVVTDAYELGSVIKVCAALACLQEGVVTPDELIDCKNTKTTYIDGRKINTVVAHGVIPFSDVIAYSNNIGIAIAAKRLNEKIYDHYKQLGFGVKTGIEFPGENSGFLNKPQHWSKQSIISLSYGYEVSATLLRLACIFCIIATGCNVTPHVLSSQHYHLYPSNKRSGNHKLYSDHVIATMKDILEKTTTRGTTRRAAIKGYRVMSKTGTANLLINGAYDTDKNIYTCAGIIEKGDYQRVVVVFIKEAQQKNIYAATVAAPLFEAVAERMLIHDGIIV